MSLAEIAEELNKHLVDRPPLKDRIKIDCGEAGMLTVAGNEAVVADEPADCTIHISEDNFVKLLTGKLNPMTAFAFGKIKVSGDMSVAMKLGELVK